MIGKIAMRYASALVDLALEKGEQDVVRDELGYFSELMRSVPSLALVFANPAVTRPEKERLLDALLQRTRPTRLTENFLRLLVKNDRFPHLEEMYAAFLKELDNRMGIVTANVVSAHPLTEDQSQLLKRQLEQLTGKRVRLNASTEPELIGGVIVRIDSEVYDGSIQTQLERLRRQLAK